MGAYLCCVLLVFFFSSRRRHTSCALVTGVQTCALPISSVLSCRYWIVNFLATSPPSFFYRATVRGRSRAKIDPLCGRPIAGTWLPHGHTQPWCHKGTVSIPRGTFRRKAFPDLVAGRYCRAPPGYYWRVHVRSGVSTGRRG